MSCPQHQRETLLDRVPILICIVIVFVSVRGVVVSSYQWSEVCPSNQTLPTFGKYAGFLRSIQHPMCSLQAYRQLKGQVLTWFPYVVLLYRFNRKNTQEPTYLKNPLVHGIRTHAPRQSWYLPLDQHRFPREYRFYLIVFIMI